MFKVVALDLDGTLLNNDHLLSEESKKVIRKLGEQKLDFILASGRPFRSMLPFAEELRIRLPLITTNGALVKSVTGNDYCKKNFIPSELVRAVIDFGLARQGNIIIYGEKKTYSFDRASAEKQRHLEKINVEVITEFNPEIKVLKIVFYASPETNREMVKALASRFGNQLSITQSQAKYLEVMKQGVSKGQALQGLLTKLGISREQLVVFGNGLNDLSMFSIAGFSVAMDNSPDELKHAADFICKSNLEDGVVHALKLLFE